MKTRLTFLLVLLISATTAFGQTQTVNIGKSWKDVTKKGFYEMSQDQVDSLVVDHFYKRKLTGAMLILGAIAVPSFNVQVDGEPLFPGLALATSLASLGLLTGGIVIMTNNRRKILYQHLTGEVPLTEEKLIKILKDRYEEENGE